MTLPAIDIFANASKNKTKNQTGEPNSRPKCGVAAEPADRAVLHGEQHLHGVGRRAKGIRGDTRTLKEPQLKRDL